MKYISYNITIKTEIETEDSATYKQQKTASNSLNKFLEEFRYDIDVKSRDDIISNFEWYRTKTETINYDLSFQIESLALPKQQRKAELSLNSFLVEFRYDIDASSRDEFLTHFEWKRKERNT